MLENSRASSIRSVAGRTSLLSTQGISSVMTTPSLLAAMIVSNRLAWSNTLRVGPHARSRVYFWQQPNRTRHQRQRLFDRCHRRRGDLPRQHHDRPSGYLLWFRDDRVHLFLPDSHRGSVEQVRRDCHLTIRYSSVNLASSGSLTTFDHEQGARFGTYPGHRSHLVTRVFPLFSIL